MDKEVVEHKGGVLPSQGSRRRVKGKQIIAWIFYDSFWCVQEMWGWLRTRHWRDGRIRCRIFRLCIGVDGLRGYRSGWRRTRLRWGRGGSAEELNEVIWLRHPTFERISNSCPPTTASNLCYNTGCWIRVNPIPYPLCVNIAYFRTQPKSLTTYPDPTLVWSPGEVRNRLPTPRPIPCHCDIFRNMHRVFNRIAILFCYFMFTLSKVVRLLSYGNRG